MRPAPPSQAYPLDSEAPRTLFPNRTGDGERFPPRSTSRAKLVREAGRAKLEQASGTGRSSASARATPRAPSRDPACRAPLLCSLSQATTPRRGEENPEYGEDRQGRRLGDHIPATRSGTQHDVVERHRGAHGGFGALGQSELHNSGAASKSRNVGGHSRPSRFQIGLSRIPLVLLNLSRMSTAAA